MLTIIFWILIFLIFYTYLGYGLLLLFLNTLRKIFYPAKPEIIGPLPEVTLLIAAYNEKDIVDQKVRNTREIDYPSDLLKVVWITDGSHDGTPEYLARYPELVILHQAERKGKTAALNRAMLFITSPVTVFSDANTVIRPDAIRKLVTPFNDSRVGCVAGEKRIIRNVADIAAGAGEGAYWRYESWLKTLESDYSSALAAAGELYAIRTELFRQVDPDMIIDDFVISMNIASQGFLIKYRPDAVAEETSSANLHEELKRKIRIASGALQTIFRYPRLLNIFRYGFLSFEFISHKVFRWIVVPLAIPLILIISVILGIQTHWDNPVYTIIVVLQVVFYIFVLLGLLLEGKPIRIQAFFLPSYLIIVNYAQYAGFIRFCLRKHNVVWDKAKRA